MTAFVKADIPASIDTLEKLGVWVSLALEKVNPDLTVIEGSGPAVAVSDTGIFDVPQTKKTRLIARLSFEVNEDFAYSGNKIWDEIKEFSSTVLPTGFKDAA